MAQVIVEPVEALEELPVALHQPAASRADAQQPGRPPLGGPPA
jgi:hypothetical protein